MRPSRDRFRGEPERLCLSGLSTRGDTPLGPPDVVGASCTSLALSRGGQVSSVPLHLLPPPKPLTLGFGGDPMTGDEGRARVTDSLIRKSSGRGVAQRELAVTERTYFSFHCRSCRPDESSVPLPVSNESGGKQESQRKRQLSGSGETRTVLSLPSQPPLALCRGLESCESGLCSSCAYVFLSFGPSTARFLSFCAQKENGAPTVTQRSGDRGERRRNGTDEPCPPRDRARDVQFASTTMGGGMNRLTCQLLTPPARQGEKRPRRGIYHQTSKRSKKVEDHL